jgi:flagellar protein FlgJ
MPIMGIARDTVSVAQPNTRLGQTVEKLAGTLWYNMMTEMNRSGLDQSALGPGGDTYQNMFLWEMSQKDFAKYDTQIVQATMRQIGGEGTRPQARPAESFAATSASLLPQVTEAAAENFDSSSEQAGHAQSLTKVIWPAVKAAASVLGVPPVGLLAQAALETGWGSSIPGYNFFGIKAGGDTQASLRATHEMVNGALVPVVDSFRDYASPDASLSDYVQLIQANFPNVLGQSSIEGFAQALQAGGYATDGAYAAKIIAIARSPLMQQMLQDVGDTGN